MARVAFPLVLQSPVTGSALVGATATITKHVVGASLGSGAEAEIFTTETESTKVSGNKIVTDNTGRWTQGEAAIPAYAQYWIPEGRYDILISGTGLKSAYITRELVTTEVSVGESQIANGAVTGPKLGSDTVRQETGTTQSFLSWGWISETGKIEAGSGDYTVERTETGEYKIVWDHAKASNKYAVIANPNLGGEATTFAATAYALVEIDHEGKPRNSAFSFMVLANN